MAFLCFILFLLLGIIDRCRAQDLSGTWEGQIEEEYMKMVLIKQGSTYVGYTYDEGMGFCKANFLGSFKNSTHHLIGAGQSFIERTINHILCNYRLKYSVQDDGKYLVG